MIVSRGKLFIVILLFLTGTSVSAEVPVSHSERDHTAQQKTGNPAYNAARPGMQWQILPGEDIPQIGHLMFPHDAVARDAFVRAVIRTNPEHFPDGIYRPIPAGTVIHIPDLRTIGKYAKPATKAHPSNASHNANKSQPQASAPDNATSDLNEALQLIAQLEQIAENETNELNILLKRIESIEKQITAMQAILMAHVPASSNERRSESAAPIPPEEMTHPSQEAVAAPPADSSVQSAENIVTAPQSPANTPQPANPIVPVETNPAAPESALLLDNAFLLGILLTLLIIFLIVRNYQRIKERLAQSRDTAQPFDPSERHQYEALLLRRSDDKKTESPQNPPEPPGQLVSEARTLLEQENPEAAIQLLQKQLAKNKQDVPGWLLLFELLYKANDKRDFKKNARRFKRLGEFPGIWQQIQKLGNQLEPNEPLYFDEQKRKEKFFSDPADAEK
ncbi:hypothetical protein R2083_05420 [Nitrosomonas sp. Is35]|uniref:hypothetical protein n=1 Tax=Nitrosomonas sp. Is35 TaxID=3080534 RepID=UPI00294B52B7|nr:hypothetical protein [Nitrosomonas sp. Is35]MDV6346955.1 hypothetical protein [Nitrosomonas sp. Is35]